MDESTLSVAALKAALFASGADAAAIGRCTESQHLAVLLRAARLVAARKAVHAREARAAEQAGSAESRVDDETLQVELVALGGWAGHSGGIRYAGAPSEETDQDEAEEEVEEEEDEEDEETIGDEDDEDFDPLSGASSTREARRQQQAERRRAMLEKQEQEETTFSLAGARSATRTRGPRWRSPALARPGRVRRRCALRVGGYCATQRHAAPGTAKAGPWRCHGTTKL